MAQYIDKSLLVAWIESQIDILERNSGCSGIFGETQMAVFDRLYSFLDTLEVKEKNEGIKSSDLEEAAWTYYDKNKPLVSHELDLHKEMISFFIAGAQWQKKHLFDNRIKDYDLEEAARKIATRHSHISGDTYYANDAWFFKKGAQWQKANLWKDAQGDDLPEIDREVIVLVKSLPEHEDSLLKVSFAHRPPEYWEGKNIGTGKITRYEPKRYDKGGWNQPNVVYWLDVELPKEEE